MPLWRAQLEQTTQLAVTGCSAARTSSCWRADAEPRPVEEGCTQKQRTAMAGPHADGTEKVTLTATASW